MIRLIYQSRISSSPATSSAPDPPLETRGEGAVESGGDSTEALPVVEEINTAATVLPSSFTTVPNQYLHTTVLPPPSTTVPKQYSLATVLPSPIATVTTYPLDAAAGGCDGRGLPLLLKGLQQQSRSHPAHWTTWASPRWGSSSPMRTKKRLHPHPSSHPPLPFPSAFLQLLLLLHSMASLLLLHNR